MSSDSATKARGKAKRNKSYKKEQLPFANDIPEEPIPPLSPILCNHHFPLLELVSAEDHAGHWVSPQCSICELRPKRRRRKQTTRNGPKKSLVVDVGQSQCSAGNAPHRTKLVSRKHPTPKEQFLSRRAQCKTQNHSIVAPETPINEQGMTLREKLSRKSKRSHINFAKELKES